MERGRKEIGESVSGKAEGAKDARLHPRKSRGRQAAALLEESHSVCRRLSLCLSLSRARKFRFKNKPGEILTAKSDLATALATIRARKPPARGRVRRGDT